MRPRMGMAGSQARVMYHSFASDVYPVVYGVGAPSGTPRPAPNVGNDEHDVSTLASTSSSPVPGRTPMRMDFVA